MFTEPDKYKAKTALVQFSPTLKKNLFELKLIVYIVMSDHKLINIQVFFFVVLTAKSN